MADMRKCSRCFLTGTVNHFAKSKRGEWYKMCNNCRSGCRERNRTYNEIHKDRIKQKNTIYRQIKKEMKQKRLDNAMDVLDSVQSEVKGRYEDMLPHSSNIFSNAQHSSNIFGNAQQNASSIFQATEPTRDKFSMFGTGVSSSCEGQDSDIEL